MFNAFQSQACPLIMILFQFLLFLISEIQLRNIVFHTFNSYLLDSIKIRTEHFALKQMLCYLRMDISFEVRANAISLICNIIIFFSKTYPSFLTVKEGSTFLTKPLFPQGREDVTALRSSEPLRYKVGGPSKVFARLCGMGPLGEKILRTASHRWKITLFIIWKLIHPLKYLSKLRPLRFWL